MTRCIVFYDGDAGRKIASFLQSTYPDDVVAFVVTSAANREGTALRLRGQGALVLHDEQVSDIVRLARTCDFGVLAWWPNIIRDPLLSGPKRGFFNTHPSLLPHARGKHTTFWTLREKAPFGVTIHQVTSDVDAGNIVRQREIVYDWTDTAETLYLKGRAAMVELFAETYPLLKLDSVPTVEQDPESGSSHYAQELESRETGEIVLDKAYRAEDLLNMLRAKMFSGRPACWFRDGDRVYEVRISITNHN
jgi:methionyl-tRNA formyltransferase